MTAHWVDENFVLHRKVLGMFLHEGGSTSEELLEKFISIILNKIKLSTANLFAVTTDTASPMNKFGSLLMEMETYPVGDAGSRAAIQERVLSLMREHETKLRGPEAAGDEEVVVEVAEESQDLLADADDDEAWLDSMEAQLAGEVPPEDGPALDSVEAVCADELKRYIATPAMALRCNQEDKKTGKITRVHNNPLEWWARHKTVFPILAQLARIYLPIQATSAPSERIFSQAALVRKWWCSLL